MAIFQTWYRAFFEQWWVEPRVWLAKFSAYIVMLEIPLMTTSRDRNTPYINTRTPQTKKYINENNIKVHLIQHINHKKITDN